MATASTPQASRAVRRRIVTLAVLSAVVATSLFGIPLAAAVAVHYVAQEATELEHTAGIVALDVAADVDHAGRPGQLPIANSGTTVGLYDSGGRLIAGQGPSRADDIVLKALADSAIQRDSASSTMVAAVPVPDQAGGVYAVRASTATSEIYPRIGLTWLAMLALGAAMVLIAWQLARWQARRLARPVEALAGSASRLADGDFSVSLGRSGIPEIDTAASALNNAASRIGELVERERAVTAHASHQLRTPLAGLRLSLENALHSPAPDYRAAAIEAVASADRLERTIDDLLALARDHERRNESPDIAVLLDELDRSWRGLLIDRGRALRIVIDPHLDPPRCSAAAVRQILAVLVDNAVRHGSGTVSIHGRDVVGSLAIDVADQGVAGTDAETALRDDAGAGNRHIGLRLARRLADAEGGRLLLTRRSPATFTFFLPESA